MTQEGVSVTRGEVAKGAGLAGLARAAALIEALAQPLYTWLFGLATYGLYVVLWGVVNLVSNIVDLAMTAALQRKVPTAENEEEAHGAVKFALLVSVVPATLLAALAAFNAEAVANIFSAAPDDRSSLPTAIRIFAWALPIWTFIEVATAAARARRAFGPEIRLRIFWEQVARILFALLFFTAGFANLGLVAAHLASLTLTAILSIRLLGRYYNLTLLLRAPVPAALARNLLGSGLALLPASLSRRMLIDASPVLINLMLPGARGASAAGLFEIARKISTLPLIVRQAFQYVMGPLSSAQAKAQRAALAPIYRFASRVSTALVVPMAGLLIFSGADILSLYSTGAAAALPLLYILVTARAAEAVVGPATAIIEMTGHRGLPLLNSLIGIFLWIILALWLVPTWGEIGMAVAVAAATVAIAYAATVELQLSDRLSPFDSTLLLGLAIGLTGVGLMALVDAFSGGPARFGANLLLWAVTSWCSLRFGLSQADREALGGFSRRLRLVP